VIGSKIEGRGHNLLRPPATLHRNRSLGAIAESFHVPGLGDIGQEWARENGIHPHGWTVGIGKCFGHRIEPRLRRGVGDDVLARSDRADAGDVDDGAPAGIHHALPYDGRQPERSLQVQVQNAVVELLVDIEGSVVERGFPCIVDEDVDPTKARVCRIRENVTVMPTTDMAGMGHGPAAELLDRSGHFLARFNAATGDNDISTGLGKTQCHSSAQPSAAARYQHDLSLMSIMCCFNIRVVSNRQ